MSARVLVCDDEASLREMLGVLLRREKHEVVLADCVTRAKQEIAQAEPFDAVVTDLTLPDGSGMDVLDAARARDASTQVIVITAYGTIHTAVEAMAKGAYSFVEKPFREGNKGFVAALAKALEKRAILRENRILKARIERLAPGRFVGESPAMKRVHELVRRVASARTSVLITGESGTGKEMVARALHEESDRAEAPFVVVNCGALPETLMESELFGHEKGAFTGATQKKDGLFRAAAGGTIFLDEIGELAMPLQVKLLRALQERKIRSVGGQKELDVDVRVVAATNRELEKEVEAGRFRQDLFYRLNVIRIHLPPLRERADDVSLLADHFVAKHGALQGKRLTLSSDARRWILAQPYPGNVRELENVIERAVTMALADEIVVEDLAEPMRPSGTPELGKVTLGPGFEIDRWLGDMEKSLLVRALGESSGSQTRAAKLLGTSFRSFRYRLQKYGLAADDSTETEIE